MDKLLLLFLSLLSLLAVVVALYPLRRCKGISFLIPMLMIGIAFAYYQWGAGSEWTAFLQKQAQQKKAEALFQSIKSPSQLIDKLQTTLAKHPQSVRGWYLLGRLYATQHRWIEARDAFAKVHKLNPKDEAASVNYAQSLWQLNHFQFNETIRQLFQQLLERNAKQPDALAMLAMDAFTSKQYQLAIDYWQRLLALAPVQSKEAAMIHKAIAKAHKQLAAS